MIKINAKYYLHTEVAYPWYASEQHKKQCLESGEKFDSVRVYWHIKYKKNGAIFEIRTCDYKTNETDALNDMYRFADENNLLLSK